MQTLEEYRDWFLAQPASALRVIEHRTFGALSASVVHREAPFQVELVITGPSSKLVAHRHPHIHAYEVHISGDMRIVVAETAEQAEQSLSSGALIPEKIYERARRTNGHFLEIRSTDWHAGAFGAGGASFWSIQKWNDGEPMTAAGIDWEGPAIT